MIYKKKEKFTTMRNQNRKQKLRLLFDSLRSHHSLSVKSNNYLVISRLSLKPLTLLIRLIQPCLRWRDLPVIYGSNPCGAAA